MIDTFSSFDTLHIKVCERAACLIMSIFQESPHLCLDVASCLSRSDNEAVLFVYPCLRVILMSDYDACSMMLEVGCVARSIVWT